MRYDIRLQVICLSVNVNENVNILLSSSIEGFTAIMENVLMVLFSFTVLTYRERLR